MLKIIKNLKKLVMPSLTPKRHSIIEALELVAPMLPAPVYWHDKAGVVLGINELYLEGIELLVKKLWVKTFTIFIHRKLRKIY
ncbi:MAG: hypothetical protein KBD37_05660 [Burkholderiales bacterium]|nr:hypothetical protein [Burkholderiales bacterium]